MRALLSLTASLAAMLLAPPARTQERCFPRDELSTCVASDNLWTHAGAGRWFSQAPTTTAPSGSAAFSFAQTFYRRPIAFVIASPDPDGTTVFAVENALGATFSAAAGITDRLEVGIAVPVVLYQSGASKSDVVGSNEGLPRSAVGDMRFSTRVALLGRDGDDDGLGLAARFELAAPTAHDDAFAGHPSVTWAPGMSLDYRVGKLHFGADLAARLRRSVLLATNVIGSQLALSLGGGYDIVDDGWLSVNLEAFALFGLTRQYDLEEDPQTFRSRVIDGPPHIPLEWMLSARTAGLLEGRFVASLGAGTFIPTAADIAVTSPQMRVALALSYVFEAMDEREDDARESEARAQNAR